MLLNFLVHSNEKILDEYSLDHRNYFHYSRRNAHKQRLSVPSEYTEFDFTFLESGSKLS
ncbi:MAG: hypothetical protein R3C28_00615 [Pirellulaceae bacterium]